MPWFKVDDAFHASRKVRSIPPRQRFAAVGLWAIAGSWCSQEMTDGHVPDYMIREWGATAKVVDALVDCGLWERVRGGFEFCSWLEYNPSKAQTKAERDASKARMRASRERRRAKSAGQDPATEDVAPQPPRNSVDVLQRPDPTRPDPYIGASAQLSPSARDDLPPPDRCPAHVRVEHPPACGGCAQARRDLEAWQTEKRRADIEAEREWRATQADAERAAIDDCDLCDDRGYRNRRVCNHDPTEDERRRRGLAEARSILAEKGIA